MEVLVLQEDIFPVVKLDNNKFQVIVDLALYSKDVITDSPYSYFEFTGLNASSTIISRMCPNWALTL